MALICLREQPMVERLEWYIEQYGWTDDAIESAHDVAEELFGVCELDIEDEIALDDPRFEFLKMMRDEADQYWAQFGWDVTDGNGKQLRSMEYLSRPLLCALKRLHPDAKLAMADQAWAARLEDEARRFQSKRAG